MTGNNKLIYLYDDTGTPYGYIYNDTSYYYEKNAQGDVVGLYYQNGIKIANYTYDAWGNVTSIINQYGEDVTGLPRHQGNLNPIRYRGYHYDAELEMYWLTTRFYNPEIGRFINADGQLNSGLFGNNLYAYCSNDSVNGHDPTGSCACMAGMFDCGHCRRAASKEEFKCHISIYEYGYRIEKDSKLVRKGKFSSIVSRNNDGSYEITTIFDVRKDISFNYKISNNGIIRFIFPDMTDKQKEYFKDYYMDLGHAMLVTGKAINDKFLQGRTSAGIALELGLHYQSYWLIPIKRLDTADMGSTEKGTWGYDSNAYLFE